MNRLERTAVFSAIATAVIAAVKFAAGTAFGSIALIADAIHSFTDIIGSAAVFFGIRFSDVKTKQFPYGLYKLENLVSLFLSLLIFYTAFEILGEAIAALGSPGERVGAIAIAAAVFSLAVSVLLAKYKLKVGKEEGSPSMVSEGKHTQTDAISTVGVLIAVSASFMGFPTLDPIVGLAVAVLVFKAGAEILIDSGKVLLDASLDYKTMRKIERIAAGQKDIRVKELSARNSGRYVFVDLKLETDIKDLKKVDQLRQKCEQKVREQMPRIDKISIEVEYRKKEQLTYAVPLMKKGKKAPVAPAFGTAPYFGLFKVSNKPGEKSRLRESKVIENPHSKSKEKKGILAAELLAKKAVDVLLTQHEMHKGGAHYALEDSYIQSKKTGKKTFKEILKQFG